MDQPARVRPRDLRASDTDREAVIGALTSAYAAGRLTAEEHEERMQAAFTARTLGELAVLLRDLPNSAEAGLPDLDDSPLAVAFGRRDRAGRWVVPEEFTASAIGGTITLDFTRAVFATKTVTVTALCLAGSVQVLAPRSVQVRVDRSRLVGLRRIRTRKTDRDPAFTILLRARGAGHVTVRTMRDRS